MKCWIRVDLPEPVWRMRPVISPSWISRSTWSRALAAQGSRRIDVRKVFGDYGHSRFTISSTVRTSGGKSRPSWARSWARRVTAGTSRSIRSTVGRGGRPPGQPWTAIRPCSMTIPVVWTASSMWWVIQITVMPSSRLRRRTSALPASPGIKQPSARPAQDSGDACQDTGNGYALLLTWQGGESAGDRRPYLPGPDSATLSTICGGKSEVFGTKATSSSTTVAIN